MLPQQSEYSLKDSVGYRLTELSGQMKAEMRRRVAECGITTQQGGVLFALSRGGDLNVTQLADRTGDHHARDELLTALEKSA